jgi:metallophosphoesterase (TIGR00282 family)
MNILFVGDMVGKGARKAAQSVLPDLKRKYNVQFCIANAENIAGGCGVRSKTLEEFPPGLIDVFTGGDHIWDHKEFEVEIASLKNFIRPANLKTGQPGRGYGIFRNPGGGDLAVINLLGRIFMKDAVADCPFDAADKIISSLPPNLKTIIVDIHAEATSEKAAMAHFLDGRVTAVLGTHTHVQTNDAVILPKGTAFISDVGMVGADNSILGREVGAVIKKFISGMPTKLPVEERNIRLDAVVISYDYASGRASAITKIRENCFQERLSGYGDLQ